MRSASKIVVLTAHGQPSDPEAPEHSLAAWAQQVAGFLPDWELRSATLATRDRLEQVMADGALVYPFFMASGWFTSQVLPQRLGAFRHRILPPFGQDPHLPQLTSEILRHEIKAQATTAGAVAKPAILLAAHGSARGPKAAEATETFAAALRPLMPDCAISTGYVEQSPTIAEAAVKMPQGSLCLPFFAQSGDHVKEDIPAALLEADFGGGTLPALGTFPAIAQLISQAILRGAAQ
ncbi:CbiX/SirB N-terminal domain-containing protein [Pseudophaeobacter leonis]|uniref:CbiX/SirB N-terminal domain-containing protein n=1 Tax=Pseudophaeobacter leonis TaxID=1144477 RepID=UPI0009F732EB|nr:CbiX/SirB N-terminal domain-containing protein [Pseudophaeobacter leonis]